MKAKTPVSFYSDIYFMNFYLWPGWTREEMRSFCEIDIDLNCYGIMFYTEAGIYIWVDHSFPSWIGCLVHECVHAANALFTMKGVKISTKNDEAQAYLVQWIFDNCHPHCLKVTTPKRKTKKA